MTADSYYYRKLGRTLGPYDIRYMRQLVKKAQINANTDISTDGVDWQKARVFGELFAEPEAASAPTGGTWHYTIGGAQQSPVPLESLQQLILAGRVQANDMAWSEAKKGDWQPVGTHPELQAFLGTVQTGAGGGSSGGGSAHGSGAPGDVAAKVKPPAIGLVVIYALNVFGAIGLLVMWLLVSFGAMAMPVEEGALAFFYGVWGLASNALGLVFGLLCLVSAVCMLKMKYYGFALTGAIISVIPCLTVCYCYPLNLGFGIWALVVLTKQEVREAFS